MRRDELDELHYITPIANVPSICELGILSHRRASRVEHQSVAMPEIQDRRAHVVVPGGRPLHEYANLYICARNPMMYLRRGQDAELCIFRVSTNVLDLPRVVVTDANAAADSPYVRFAAAPGGLRIVDRGLTFAEYWTSPDLFEQYRRKSAKCAEVLVPDLVPPRFLIGAYVSSENSRTQFDGLSENVAATVNPHIFFR